MCMMCAEGFLSKYRMTKVELEHAARELVFEANTADEIEHISRRYHELVAELEANRAKELDNELNKKD